MHNLNRDITKYNIHTMDSLYRRCQWCQWCLRQAAKSLIVVGHNVRRTDGRLRGKYGGLKDIRKHCDELARVR